MAEEARTLTHIGVSGEAHMVDVGDQAETVRIAVAEGFIRMAPETLDLILKGDAKKGDVIGTARLAGITATIILLVPHPGTSAQHMMLSRISEVSWGVTVAIAIVWLAARLTRRGTGS